MVYSADYIAGTMLMIKPLSILDGITNFFLTFPILSFFMPRFVRIWLIKVVVCLKVYFIGFACCLKQLFRWKRLNVSQATFANFNQRQPLAIVTGGTSGLGLALCQLLAPKWRLIILGRDRRQGHLAIEQIKKRCGVQCKIIFYSVDLSSRKSINEFLEIFIKTFDRLHLLVNNAGVMMPPYQAVGASGDIELQWAVNFLAPVYLTDRLRPCLQRALIQDGFSRVVNVSSACLYAGSLSPEYFACAGGCNGTPSRYSSHLAYANSKLALSLFTELYAMKSRDADREPVTTCSVHPGAIATDLYRHTNVFMRWFMRGRVPFTSGRVILTTEQAANDLLWACLSPLVESGGFYENGSRLPLPAVKAEVKMLLWKHLERQDIVSKPIYHE